MRKNGRRFALFIFLRKRAFALFSQGKEGEKIMTEIIVIMILLLLILIVLYMILKK